MGNGLRSEEKKGKSNTKILKTIWNVITWILVAAFIFMAVALVGVRLLGLRPFAVLSGSMEPTYRTGSIVYVKKTDYHLLQAGDPITFMLDEKTVATHRIVEVVPDEQEPDIIRFRTKGDNNDDVDGGLVHCGNVVGKAVFSIPYLGFVSDFIQHPPGTYVVIGFCGLLFLLAFLPDLLAEHSEGETKETDRESKQVQ